VETSRPAGMRRRATVALGAGAAVALLVGVGQPVGRPARADAAVKASFARLPLSFVVNRGQLDRRVSFAVQGRDASALFARRGVSYVLGGRHVVKVDFVGARAVEPVGQRRLAGIVSVFKGDRSQWRTGIPTFRGIVYRDLWPGIDLVWSGAQGRLKYTLVVRPGADPAAIKLRYRGAKLSVEDGGLVVRTPVRTLHEGRPVGSSPLAYTLRGEIVGFRASGYDRSRTLVIDPPALLYAGFLGGSGDDDATGIAVDSAGNAYITGPTLSTAATFPDTPGALDQSDNGGYEDAFVAKVNAAGDALV
jgi:Beta-propeller repeat